MQGGAGRCRAVQGGPAHAWPPCPTVPCSTQHGSSHDAYCHVLPPTVRVEVWQVTAERCRCSQLDTIHIRAAGKVLVRTSYHHELCASLDAAATHCTRSPTRHSKSCTGALIKLAIVGCQDLRNGRMELEAQAACNNPDGSRAHDSIVEVGHDRHPLCGRGHGRDCPRRQNGRQRRHHRACKHRLIRPDLFVCVCVPGVSVDGGVVPLHLPGRAREGVGEWHCWGLSPCSMGLPEPPRDAGLAPPQLLRSFRAQPCQQWGPMAARGHPTLDAGPSTFSPGAREGGGPGGPPLPPRTRAKA